MSSSNRSKSNANNKQFLCPHCHRCFTQKGNLKTHMMIHSGEKPYACQICGKSFTQKGNVDTHMKIHTGEKEYNCGSCGKKFTQKGNLKTHVRSVHTKEKPFVCGMCGKSFSQKGNMLTHLRTHNKDDRFPCTLCGKTFSQKGNLKTHMQRHSGQLPARRYGQRRQSSNGSHSHGHSRLMQQGGQSFSAGSSESAKAGKQSMFKNVHEDSGSPAEHSLLTSSHNQAQLHHQISGLGIPVSSEEALNSHHSQGALKLTHVAAFHRDQSMLDSIHSSQNQHLHAAHRSPVSSPVAMQFSQAATVAAAARFYPSNPGMAAPLAHASWLAAASATAAGLSAKGRNPATPYDNFNFGYASFQHPGSHFGRGLTLLNSTIPLTAPDTIQHGRQSNSNTPETSVAVTTSTSQQPGNHSSQSQYSQSTANPDFSQLLE
ncbi:Gastrula zinc finger protein XlCGF8.2DB [Halotydeus destructor]|nr:Gastrula zinc finger protein XlCGF8.2DB [Halotydeus destructor]